MPLCGGGLRDECLFYRILLHPLEDCGVGVDRGRLNLYSHELGRGRRGPTNTCNNSLRTVRCGLIKKVGNICCCLYVNKS